MHAMSYRSDFFAYSCRVKCYKPAVCYNVTLVWAVFRVGIPSFPILTAKLDSKSLNTSLLEVMISSKNERVYIRNLGDLILQIIFDAWGASINVG